MRERARGRTSGENGITKGCSPAKGTKGRSSKQAVCWSAECHREDPGCETGNLIFRGSHKGFNRAGLCNDTGRSQTSLGAAPSLPVPKVSTFLLCNPEGETGGNFFVSDPGCPRRAWGLDKGGQHPQPPGRETALQTSGPGLLGCAESETF